MNSVEGQWVLAKMEEGVFINSPNPPEKKPESNRICWWWNCTFEDEYQSLIKLVQVTQGFKSWHLNCSIADHLNSKWTEWMNAWATTSKNCLAKRVWSKIPQREESSQVCLDGSQLLEPLMEGSYKNNNTECNLFALVAILNIELLIC